MFETQIIVFICRLYDIVTQKCGSGAADTVRGFRAEQYPLVVVLMKNRSSLEVSAVIQGNICDNDNSFINCIYALYYMHYIVKTLYKM